MADDYDQEHAERVRERQHIRECSGESSVDSKGRSEEEIAESISLLGDSRSIARGNGLARQGAVLQLQRALGNHIARRLLQDRPAESSPATRFVQRGPGPGEPPPKAASSQGSGSGKGYSPLDSEFFVKHGKHLLSVAGRFLPKPGGTYLTWYKTHFGVLLGVLAAVRKGEPIKSGIREMEKNVESYVREAKKLASDADEIPIDPLAGTSDADVSKATKDPAAAAAYEKLWTTYESTLRAARRPIEECLATGRRMKTETSTRVDALAEEIEKLSGKSSMDVIVKQSLVQELQLFQISFEERLEEGITACERARDHLSEASKNTGTQ